MTKIYLCGLKNEILELEMKYKININKNMLYSNTYQCNRLDNPKMIN